MLQLSAFRPKLIDALRGYDRQRFFKDLGAGLTVSVVALPISMAFAIACGLKPEAGLVTAIVAGFLTSALGGSRVQISGAAGGFVVMVYGIVHMHGVNGLMLATLMSGMWLLLMGVFRLGVLIRFIPVAVITGFTNGIAVLIGMLQLKDFLGLPVQTMPADVFGIVSVISTHLNQTDIATLALTLSSLLVLVFWQLLIPRWLPASVAQRLSLMPGPMLVMLLATAFVYTTDWPVATIGSRFGGIPSSLLDLSWPTMSLAQLQAVLVPGFTLAVLGAISSLLCARASDSMIGDRHDPNQELMAQGLANMAMPFVGGMPATGALARTVTNVKNGASSPVAGMVHALGLLLIVLLAAPLVSHIPLGVLSALLLFIAWNMGDWRAFVRLSQFRWPYRFTLLAVFVLTVLVDLSVGMAVGLAAACLTFIYRISSLTQRKLLHATAHTQVWAFDGALFFGAVDLIEQTSHDLPEKTLVLDLGGLIYIDSSGADGLHGLLDACEHKHVELKLCALNPQPLDILGRTGLLARLKPGGVAVDWQTAVRNATE
ncbi:MAG: SulP family inorganic anion transporter [Burkholderiales bacterium]|nr:SulP family inorganic anion transporter [Burkholderiales bacterium]